MCRTSRRRVLKLEFALAIAFAVVIESGATHARHASHDEERARVDAYLAVFASRDPSDRMLAIRAARRLARHRDRIVPVLARFLESADAEERAWATWSLGALIPASTPELLRALSHADPAVRVCATEQIEKSIWPFPFTSYCSDLEPRASALQIVRSEGIDVLRKALSDPVDDVQTFAAMAIWKIGPAARSAQRELELAESDESPVVRFWAGQARRRIDDSPWSFVRSIAAHVSAVETSESNPPPSLASLVGQLDTQQWCEECPSERFEPKHRWIVALKLIRRWLPELLARESSADAAVAARARDALAAIERNARERFGDLIESLHAWEEPGGPRVSELVRFGPAVIPQLMDRFFDCPMFPIGYPTYAPHAWAFARLGDDGIAALAIGLEHPYDFGREWSAYALLQTGSAALPAMPAIISAWKLERGAHVAAEPNSFWDERYPSEFDIAVEGIGVPQPASAWHVGLLGTGAVPFLIAALEDRNSIVRVRAAHALEGMGAAAAPSLDVLGQRLGDSQPEVRDAAGCAVLEIAPEGSELARRALAIVEQLRVK